MMNFIMKAWCASLNQEISVRFVWRVCIYIFLCVIMFVFGWLHVNWDVNLKVWHGWHDVLSIKTVKLSDISLRSNISRTNSSECKYSATRLSVPAYRWSFFGWGLMLAVLAMWPPHTPQASCWVLYVWRLGQRINDTMCLLFEVWPSFYVHMVFWDHAW